MISVTFNKEKITLLLNIEVERSAIDKVSGEALSRKLLPKDEFHITLIGNSMGEIIKENISQLSMGDQTKILLKIENLVNEFSWNFMLKDEYYYVSKTYPKTADFEEEKRENHRENGIGKWKTSPFLLIEGGEPTIPRSVSLKFAIGSGTRQPLPEGEGV